MAPRWSSTLSSALDTSIVVPDLGSRFASCVFTSSLGVGWDQMQTTLMTPGGNRENPRVSYDFATEIYRAWRGAIGRVFIEGHLAWQGRVAEIYAHSVNSLDKSCVVELSWLGHAHDLEREAPELNPSYSEELATVSASDMTRTLIDQSSSPIAHTYAHVRETAINVGAVQTTPADTVLSLILNQLKGASSDGNEHTFLVWNPDDGPYIEPIGGGATRYMVRLDESPGAGFRWSLSEMATDCRALFTNGDDNADATPTETAIDGPALNNQLHAYKAISVDAVNLGGATAARDVYLQLHKDPSALTGSFVATDTISNLDGGLELAGLVRANELLVVSDFLPLDSLTTEADRTKAIASTSYNVFSGQLSLTLDDRATNSKENEQMTELRIAQRLTESLRAHALLTDSYELFTTPIALVSDVPQIVTVQGLTIPALRAMRVHIHIVLGIDDTADSLSDLSITIGYSLDNDVWDPTNDETRERHLLRNGAAGSTLDLSCSPKARRIRSGQHRLYVWALCDADDFTVTSCKVFVDS